MHIKIKVKLKGEIFKSSNQSIFYKFFYEIILIFFFFFQIYMKYIKMAQNLSAKYYQENKERLQKQSL